MSGHGGQRTGAGAPARGVSGAKRLILKALEGGLTIAGRERGLRGSDEEVATQAAAQVAADMVRSGRGDEVLKLMVVASPARDGEDESKRSVLADALSKLPGMDFEEAEGPGAALTHPGAHEKAAESAQYETRPSDCRSETRVNEAREPVTMDADGDLDADPQAPLFWYGQPQLPLDAGSLAGLAGSRGAYGRRGAASPAAHPRTPPGGLPADMGVGGEKLEKIRSAS